MALPTTWSSPAIWCSWRHGGRRSDPLMSCCAIAGQSRCPCDGRYGTPAVSASLESPFARIGMHEVQVGLSTPKGGRPFARTGMHEVQVGLSKEAGAADKKPDTERRRPFARIGMHEVQVGLSKKAGAADKKPDTEGIQKYKKKVYSLEKPWNTPSRQSGGRQITRRRGRRGKKQDPLHAGRRHRRSFRRHPPRPCGHRRSRCARTGRAPRWHRATGAATG